MKTYTENIKKYDAELRRTSKLLNRISFIRLLLFVASSVTIITLLSFNLLTPALVVLPISIVAFGVAIRHHSKTAFLKKHSSFLKRINESEVERLENKLGAFDTGHQFMNHNHPYTSDLDIFGTHSIFQMLNRTTTESGRMMLADWLSEPAGNDEIAARQEAIKELSPKPGWRQDFQASGMHYQNRKSDYHKLLNWVNAPATLLKSRGRYLATAIILSVLSLLGFYFFMTNLVEANLNSSNWFIYIVPFVMVLVVNYLVLRNIKPTVEKIVLTSQQNIDTLKGYETLIRKIENENFKSERLRTLQASFIKSHYSASREINRLCNILEFSQHRPIKGMSVGGNNLYPIFNSLLLLDIYLVLATEKWKAKNEASLSLWANAVSEFEVLSSLAGFSYSNPDYAFPEITEKDHYLHFEALGHPLIHSQKRVCNDFQTEGPGDVVMITGSNMGGKSTFLRTVGVNLVLALTGAPCCADYGKVSNLQLFTSMRTQDNLKEGVSSFYAELDRIESMLKLINSRNNVFFLLDEMFKGTNSEDRHKGGFSLISQISGLKTSGIVATHDIELAKLLEKKSLVTNYSFNSKIEGDAMLFSYKLDHGICNDFNASELMKNSGINILPDVTGGEA